MVFSENRVPQIIIILTIGGIPHFQTPNVADGNFLTLAAAPNFTSPAERLRRIAVAATQRRSGVAAVLPGVKKWHFHHEIWEV
jgi:hypothetical protein